MKQLSCSAIGGPATCTHMVPGNTPEEISANGMAHVTEAHPEMVEALKAMTPEQTAAWNADVQAKLDAASDMAAAA